MTIEFPNAPTSAAELRIEIACQVYAQGLLGKLSAAEMAGVDVFTFQGELKKREIPLYTEAMFADDLESLKVLFPVIVVADTSVLLNLGRVQQLSVLSALFKNVTVPPEVELEFRRATKRLPRFQDLTFPEWIVIRAALEIPPNIRAEAGLDPGESAALALANEMKVAAILIDERRAHQVARKLGLRTLGVFGILLEAKTAGYLPAVRPVIDQLEKDAQFWVGAPLRAHVISLAGE